MLRESKERQCSMEAAQVSGSRFYRPELDVLRFVAFLLVFLAHTVPDSEDPRLAPLLKDFVLPFDVLQGAFCYGLSLFFTLSAFLICELLLREREITGTVKITQFYIRRILRIWPLYYLGLALGSAVAFLPGGHPTDLAMFGWFAIFMGAWYSAFHGAILNPIAPLWSVSVEEQFYLFAPWVTKFFNRKSLYGFCVALILLANSRLCYLVKASATDSRIWTDTYVQFECFAAGILLCMVLRGRLPGIAVWQRSILLATSWSCWLFASYCAQAPSKSLANPPFWPYFSEYTLAALGSALFIVAVLGMNPKRLPAWAIYCGRISFGLYVFHEFAIYISRSICEHTLALSSLAYCMEAILAVGLTFLMAALSYRYFETPFLKLKKRHAVVESQPIQGVD
jgi:peptidoglycan/LPS O-acetylase OafA/YrhL